VHITDLLADAAGQLQLAADVAWCRWRHLESRHGFVRAELTVLPAGEGPRSTAFSGAGVLRPMWDIGLRTAAGDPDLAIAGLWIEGRATLGPGESATARLAPFTPRLWAGVSPGQVLTMHESALPGGTATVLAVHPRGG